MNEFDRLMAAYGRRVDEDVLGPRAEPGRLTLLGRRGRFDLDALEAMLGPEFSLEEWQRRFLHALYSPVRPLNRWGVLLPPGPPPLPINGHEYARRRRARRRHR